MEVKGRKRLGEKGVCVDGFTRCYKGTKKDKKREITFALGRRRSPVILTEAVQGVKARGNRMRECEGRKPMSFKGVLLGRGTEKWDGTWKEMWG